MVCFMGQKRARLSTKKGRGLVSGTTIVVVQTLCSIVPLIENYLPSLEVHEDLFTSTATKEPNFLPLFLFSENVYNYKIGHVGTKMFYFVCRTL